MKRWVVFTLYIFLSIPWNANAITAIAKQKYPYGLLTEDYGILNERDLAVHTWEVNPTPFSDKESGGYNYWQCFPRDKILITLEDSGSSSEDFGWKDNIGNLKIKVLVKPGVIHEYEMRTLWTVKDFQKRFNLWRKLMKNEKYVCLAGNFSSHEQKIENSAKQETYGWIFEALKTKKGCDSYFDSYHRTYTQYLQEKKGAPIRKS